MSQCETLSTFDWSVPGPPERFSTEGGNGLFRYNEVRLSPFKTFWLKTFCVALLSLVFFCDVALSQGLDANEIYKFEPCFQFRDSAGNPPAIPLAFEKDIRDPSRFPGWAVPLSPYIDGIERLNGRHSNEQCDKTNTGLLNVSPLSISLAEVSRRTADLIVKDLQKQKSEMEKVSECLTNVSYFEADSPHGVTQEMFLPSFAKDKIPGCTKIINFLVKDLGERQKRMRSYMALTQGKTPSLGDSLSHDLPFTTMLSSALFPVQKSWQRSAAPLTDQEFAALPEFSRSLGGRSPSDLYDQLISTTPVLLLINGEVTPRKIGWALDSILAKSKFNEADFLNNISYEMFFNTPYVASAIHEMEKGEQENACLITRLVFDRLKTKYEKNPRFLSAAALLLSAPLKALSAGATAGLAKAAGSEFMRKAGLGMVGLSAVETAKLFDRYNRGMQMCTAMYRQRHEDPDVDGICSLHKMKALQEDAELTTVVNAGVFGAVVLGRPAMNAVGRLRIKAGSK